MVDGSKRSTHCVSYNPSIEIDLSRVYAEVFGYMHENPPEWNGWRIPAKRHWRASPTIKHLHISDFIIGRMATHLPTSEDMAKLFTLELKGERSAIDENI